MCMHSAGSSEAGVETGDDGWKHVDLFVVARHERVHSRSRSVPSVRADDDAADDVRRAHPTRRLHPRDDRARTRRRAGAGAPRAAARTAEDNLRRTQATA